ncbi:MAG: type II secretion system GspH family protein [Lachnospiraceae bacterium]|nr:type II secretion system GspH family protein [Lachnospiraceae bacterium]
MRREIEKDNRGFSLVELIVVVLIMAIVAVALAPQVIKWVENSRISSDLQTRTNIENACILAMTEEAAFDMVKNGGYEIIIKKDKNTGRVSFSYKIRHGDDVQTCDKNDPALLNDAFWQNFIKVGNYNSFDAFEASITIKSTPVKGQDIVLDVHVFEGGYTFSDLVGVAGEDLGVS